MPIDGAILRITPRYVYSIDPAQVILNVYHYEVSSPTTGFLGWNIGIAEAVAETFITDVLTPVAATQVAGIECVEIRFDVLTAPLFPFTVLPLSTPIPGTQPGEGLASFMAWAFKLVRTNRTTRNGQKRIAGVSESSVLGNLPVVGIEDELAAAAAGMALELNVVEDTESMTLIPVITRLDPADSLIVLAHQPVDSAVFTKLSSQNSRKLGS
jgi:hypothetical protein